MEQQQQNIQNEESKTLDIYTGLFNNKNIRIIGSKENPLFVANDIQNVFGITDIRQTIKDYDRDESFILNQNNDMSAIYSDQSSNLGIDSRQYVLTEKGLYRYVYTSKSPIGKEFRNFVFELLKRLRLGELQLVKQNMLEFQQQLALVNEQLTEQQEQIENLEEEKKQVQENIFPHNRSISSVHPQDNVNLYVLRKKDDNKSGIYYVFCCNLKSYKQQLKKRINQNYDTYQLNYDIIVQLNNVCDSQKWLKNMIKILKDLNVIRRVNKNKEFICDSDPILAGLIEFIYEIRLKFDNTSLQQLTEQCRIRLFELEDDNDSLLNDENLLDEQDI